MSLHHSTDLEASRFLCQFVNQQLSIRSKMPSNLTGEDRANIAILHELLTDNTSNKPIIKKCNTRRCKCCECIIQNSTFMDNSKTVTFNVDLNYDCNSKDII